MTIRDYEYLVSLVSLRNIRKTAEKFFVTPSALTQRLQQIESEFGAELFVRSNAGCIPTDNGLRLAETGRQILMLDKAARDEINDQRSSFEGDLKIGLPPDRGSDMFLEVYPTFHSRYPNINITLVESKTRRLQQLITNGELDLAIVGTLKSQQAKGNYVCIRREEMLALIPQELGVDEEEFRLTDYAKQPFALVGSDSTMRAWQDQIFRDAGFAPRVALETAKASTIPKMVAKGLCCSVISDYYYDPHSEGIRYYHLPQRPQWEICALYNESAYLTEPSKYFIRLARDMMTALPVLP